MRQDRQKAISLRKRGKSYNEISRILNISKGTLSLWLRNVKMPPEIEKKFWDKTRKGWAESIIRFNRQRIARARERGENIQLAAAKKIKNLTKKDLLLIGSVLYWAEGSMRSRWRVGFANSDPDMIKIVMRFFREICCIDEEKFNAKVHLHPNIKENKAVNFWSKVSGIPKNQFTPSQTQISKSSKKRRNPHQLPYGTLHLSIHSVDMANQIKGWILGVSKQVRRE